MILKICFVSPRLYLYLSPDCRKPAGGAQRQQSMVSTELANRGYHMSAIVAAYGQKAREEHQGVELIKGVPEAVSGPSSVLGALRGLTRAMFAATADIYLVRGAPRLATATYLLSKLFRKRFIFRVANDSDVDPVYLEARYSAPFLLFYKATVAGANAVIAQTEKQKQLLRSHFHVDTILVPNGYDLPPHSEVLSQEKRTHVLWVGSSDPEKKNPTFFLDLAERLPELNFSMISQPIPGKTAYHDKLIRKAESISNLDFVGPVAPDEVHDYYRTAMLLVNTSDYEGFPNTFLEAWRYETPIVSLYFDLDGLLEKECGGVRAGTIENLVATVKQLASDDSRRAKLGAEGREYMKENYSLSRVVDLYEKAFERAVQ